MDATDTTTQQAETIARRHWFTHRDTRNPLRFYKQEAYRTLVLTWDGEKAEMEEYWNTYPYSPPPTPPLPMPTPVTGNSWTPDWYWLWPVGYNLPLPAGTLTVTVTSIR
jgi:hypothetical protein